MKKIPVYQPELSGNEKKYVDECLDTNWISSKGKFVNIFETNFSKYIGVKHAIAVSNGTNALHLALMALGIGEGDEIIVPSFTYIASANAIKYTGATPVFVDSINETWQLNPDDFEAKITNKTRAVMAVHLYGHPCDMKRITEIAHKHRLLVIEDCAEAFGSKYENQYVGTFGDISAFSFFGNKTITCGEGGMVVTNADILYERAVHIKNQGLAGTKEYWHDIIGYNFRMTNICAAIGTAQLEKADDFIARKQQVVKWYIEGLKDLPVDYHKQAENVFHTYWMFSILAEDYSQREELRKKLSDNGIETRPLFYPLHTMLPYSQKYQKLPVAENLGERGMNLPSWPGLTHEDVEYICGVIRDFFENQK